MFHVELCPIENLEIRTNIYGLEGPSFCPSSIESRSQALATQNVPRETRLARQKKFNVG